MSFCQGSFSFSSFLHESLVRPYLHGSCGPMENLFSDNFQWLVKPKTSWTLLSIPGIWQFLAEISWGPAQYEDVVLPVKGSPCEDGLLIVLSLTWESQYLERLSWYWEGALASSLPGCCTQYNNNKHGPVARLTLHTTYPISMGLDSECWPEKWPQDIGDIVVQCTTIARQIKPGRLMLSA